MAIGPDMMAEILEELGCFLVDAGELARKVAPQLAVEAAAYEAHCAQVAIDTLRHSLSLRDREQAREPLREAARRLGIDLDEADEDWSRLAYRALWVMLDAAEENARRDTGIYDAQSPFFRSGRGPHARERTCVPSNTARSFAPPVVFPTPPQPVVCPGPARIPAVRMAAMEARPSPATQVERPTNSEEKPTRQTAVQLPEVTPVAKTPHVAALLLEDYFDLYIAKKVEGYTDDFGEEEVPDAAVGEKWRKSSKNNMEVGKRIWVSLLGNRLLSEISDEEIRNVKEKLRKIPESHAKSCSETRDLDALVAKTDAEEQRRIEHAVAEATFSGGSPAKIERARLDNLIPRIRVETILKHTRALNRPAKMLVKLGELETSPFQKHMISNRTADAMRRTEEKRDRRPWDDRIYDFLATPVFRGGCDEVGDPMFWAPLMALLGGGREEEILQLSPDDFETDGGIHYYRLHNMPGNSIKSDAGHREIPVHPELVRLGLIELVELRRRQGEPRLSPHLKRGKHKETFTELFTKEFTKYRQTHKVYWRGLDFHALRTTFHHRLMDNLVPGYAERALMGHEGLDEGKKIRSEGHRHENAA
ncbi:hypothetical protein LX81_01199 [Palleronia aestuarii]|uniref:Phage integrase family protein n=2 Tax=Palleronia aestuarii TaxID=568105 RepID=A0A2W7NGE5_9RHOB|nr:hypothetical protein LX81_01199 [Palleronia aestuarii]